jgi:hypothetical protein
MIPARMIKPFSAENHDLLDGPSDPMAIRNYLNIEDAVTLANRVTIHSSLENFDPRALMVASQELGIEAVATVTRLREAAVLLMNYRTLCDLGDHLGAFRGGLPNWMAEDDEEMSDPIQGPVLRRARILASLRSAKYRKRGNTLNADENGHADGRSAIPRPTLPCNLEDLLRYAANAPTISWKWLEKAFIDMLSTDRDWTVLDPDEEKQLQREVELLTAVLAGSASFDFDDPRLVRSRRDNEIQLEDFQKMLSRAREERSYRQHFRPGNQAPSSVEKDAKARYEYWRQPGCVTDETVFIRLVSDFRNFWAEHGPEYVKKHIAEESHKNAVSKKASDNGKKGVANREQAKWVRVTHAFIDYWSDGGQKRSIDDLLASVTEYSSRHSGFKSADTQNEVKEFLGALCIAADQSTGALSVLEPLQYLGVRTLKERPIKEQKARIAKMDRFEAADWRDGKIPKSLARFKSLTIETVQECLEMLKAALAP